MIGTRTQLREDYLFWTEMNIPVLSAQHRLLVISVSLYPLVPKRDALPSEL